MYNDGTLNLKYYLHNFDLFAAGISETGFLIAVVLVKIEISF
jgi:hypothetical protein